MAISFVETLIFVELPQIRLHVCFITEYVSILDIYILPISVL